MWSDPARWLATLRKWQRTIVVVSLPALALSAMSAAACAAAMHDAASPHAGFAHAAAAHAEHHEATQHDQPSAPRPSLCPHCPLETGAAPLAHITCAIVDGQDTGGKTVEPNTTLERSLSFALLPSWTLPAARAAPPLIGVVNARHTALISSVPLNVRHCVYLI